MRTVTSWGRLAFEPHEVVELRDRTRVAETIAARRSAPGIAYGMGRSYGDVCLNPGGLLWRTTGLDRFLGFDAATGRLACEAGVLLRDIQRLTVPRGWMLAVSPGTQWVTVGGAIANDVHGKNHHGAGTFGNHVLGLRLARTDGETIDCGPGLRPEWFAATVGGLGLTGVIVHAEIQLQRVPGPWLDTESAPFGDLDEFFALAADSGPTWEYTVAWIDCLSAAGRGVFMRARSAGMDAAPARARRARAVPCTPPFALVNRFSLRPLNAAYFHAKRWRGGRRPAHFEPFFYPLDTLREWNRLYGPRGFYQHQSVVPEGVGPAAVRALLQAIARARDGSLLAVLKTFGGLASPGMLSFARPGVTLALDFPNRGEPTLRLLDRLDAIVREAGGRIYPAKDARMARATFEAGYPRLSEFAAFRDRGIASAMSRRLMGS